MKQTILTLSLLFTSILAQADLGSAEIYLIKSNYSFDFISLNHLGQPVVNKIDAAPANVQTISQLSSQYIQACYDGAFSPLKELIFGLVQNERQPEQTLLFHSMRVHENGLVSFTYQVGDREPVTVQIHRCDF